MCTYKDKEGKEIKLYPAECGRCGKLARDHCLFCGLTQCGHACKRCKRAFHQKCAWKLGTEPEDEHWCQRKNCAGKPPVMWPKASSLPSAKPKASRAKPPADLRDGHEGMAESAAT